ncbi:MAG: hypothetical protein HY000_14680 [Planctomycetes bacterium]|nr:hypothetical protein [Planctomycetota bacterium]
MINQFGPTDLLDPDLETFNPAFWSAPERALTKLFGPDDRNNAELRRQASPITHVSANDAEFIFTRSVNEKLIVKSQAMRMIEKLRGVGKTVPDLYEFQGEGPAHAVRMSREEAERVWGIQQEFLDRQLK